MEELDRTQQPIIYPLKELDIALPERSVMPNGTKLTLIQGGTQDVFRMDILVHGGQWRQTMPLQALFTNRMLSEGTRSYTSVQIFEMLDRYGAWMEQNSTVNASVITLYSLNKYAKETLQVLEKILKEPVFPQKEFEVMVEQGRQMFLVNQDKVKVRAHKMFHQVLLGDKHPCAKFANIEDYLRIQTASLKEFYNAHYHSKNVSIYLSGNLTPTIIKQVRSLFGERSWGMDSALVPLVPIPPVTSKEKEFFMEMPESVQSAIRMGLLSVPISHPDYNKLNVLLTVLGGYFGSRLMSNIREEHGYTYGIGCMMSAQPFNSLLSIMTECDNQYVRAVIDEVFKEIQRVQDEEIPAEELDMVKNYMLGELTRAYENALSLSDVYIYAETSGSSDTYIQQRVDAINSVTSEELRNIAQKYLLMDDMKIVIAGKKV